MYYVTVSASTDGTYNLDLVSSGHGIKDAAENPLADTAPTTGTDHTYTVSTTVADSTAPTLTSIERSNPATQNTTSQTLVYKATFSEDVTGIDTNDFVLSSDSTGGVGGINTGNSSERFTQTRSPALAIPGVVTVSDIITVPDSGTATSVSVSVDIAHTWIGDLLVELIAPDGTTVITLHNRTGTDADNIVQTYEPDFGGVSITGNWTLRIDDNFVDDPGVLNSWTLTVDYGNAATATATPITATDISGSGDVYYVTVSASTDGTYNLDLVSSGHGIKDAAENPLADTAPTTGTDHTYTVSTTVADSTAPTLTSIERSNPTTQNTTSQTLVYKATFSEDVTGINTNDFVLSSDSTGSTTTVDPVTSISGSDDVYYVTVSASTDGTYNLDLVSSGHGIKDAAENPLADTAPTTGTDHTYTVSTTVADSTAPTLTSIERSNPAAQNTNSQTLVYKATFSEDVTGIDTDDFVLSSDSTGGVGGINTGNSSERFTQTRSPALAIPGVVTVSDIITVPDSGTATSVSVSVDIAHTWIGDLLVELIAPDGTTVITLHNRTGTDADNIVQTYEPDFGGVSITGNWTLRIDDNFVDDPGVLNSWTLTVDYGNAATATATPITATDISGSGDVYYVTVSASTDGTYNLDLVSSGHGIKDAAENPLADTAPTTGTDHTYTVSTTVADSTAPTLTSIERSNPTTQNTTSQTLVYKATFSEDVTGINTNDFVLSSDSTGSTTTVDPVTSISGSDDVYYVTVSASTDGTYNLDLVSSGHGIKDAAENPLADTAPTTGTDHTYTVSTTVADSTAPTLTSIERSNPAAQNTTSQTLVYKVTFSEDVTGIDTDDFVLSSDSTGGVGGINTGNSSERFTQTRSPALAIPGVVTVSDIITVPDSGTATSVSVSVDIAHTWIGDLLVELIAPDGTTVITLHNRTGTDADNIVQTYEPDFGGVSITGNWTLRIDDNFVDDPGVLNSWTLTVDYGNAATATATPITATDISGSGDVYYVTVSASTDGTYNLDLVSSGHGIKDAAENPLADTAPTTGTDHTYTVSTTVADSTAPTLTSIERSNPTTQNTTSQTLVYKATFSEDVTGIDTNDFVLSSDSTGGVGGINTGNSSERFTQTRSPALAIPGVVTVSDIITVPDSGTATSVSVSVDIAHTWISDLLVELIAPDGTAITLHDRGGGSADDIDQTYAPDFEGVLIAGNWTLRIDDDFVDDPGVLNSWTLTVNYGNAATATATPITATDISGSGDVYYVTVSASTDGTYNLDLVSSGHGIKDAAENPLADTAPTTGTDHTYTVSTTVADSTAPTLTSIERSNPTTQNTNSQTLVYKATFSESVTGVDTDDFVLSSDSTGGVSNSNNTVSSEQFTQTRSPALAISDLQTVSDTLTIPDSGTVTAVSVTVNISHTYIGDLKVDLIAPDGTVKTLHSGSGDNTDNIIKTYTPDFVDTQIQGGWKLKVRDNANSDVGTLNSWTLAISYDTTTTTTTTTVSPVTGISGSDDVYYVTVSALQDGTYNLDLVSSSHGIKDAAENLLTDTAPTTGTDHTYTVSTTVADSTAPTLTSIERSNPTTQNTNSQTLVYKVTFSENVTGVDASDFALSSGSTAEAGSANINGSSGQFTQTRSSPLVIPDMQTVSDIITVPDSGTATSVSVSVDIAHTWIGDLLVELIAPDGTTVITLHNRTGTDADNIVQTYEPDFGGVSITGNWTLRIDDNYDADPGVLNSWTLTVNYGNAPITTVTYISGSGDVYYVTASASTDGTYNLDLVSSDHGIADTATNPLIDTAPATGTDHTYIISTAI